MHNHILSIILFTPLAGALLLIFVPKEQKDAIRWIAQHFRAGRPAGFHPAGAVVLGAALRTRLQVHGGRAQQLDSLDRRRLRPRHRRHFLPADHADHAAGLDFDPVFVDRNREPGEGILHLVSGPADRHAGRLHGARFLPVLRFLGSHAGADVLADRHLGRPAKTLRRHQVLPLHLVRLGTDAAVRAVPVLLQLPSDRAVHLQHSGVIQDGAADLPRSGIRFNVRHLAVPGILPGLRHQGADVPVPHLAAGCPRGGAHRGFGHPGRRSAEDGNLRLRPLRPAVLPGCGDASQSARLDDFPFHHWHHLRRAGLPDAEGHEEAGGVFVGQPPGFLHPGNLRA